MVFKKKKGFMVTMPILPWLIIIVFAIILVVALLALIKTASLISADNNRASSNALQTMLNSNECAPYTKLPFKDVLAIALAEGKTTRREGVSIKYGNKTEGLGAPIESLLDPKAPPIKTGFTDIEKCLNKYMEGPQGAIGSTFLYFYVRYDACPNKKCFEAAYLCSSVGGCDVRNTPGELLDSPLTTESVEYIALPNGDVAKVVLKSP